MKQKIFDKILESYPINKGWSDDKKYCVTTTDGEKYLLRISKIGRLEFRKALFNVLDKVAALDIPMCKLIEWGISDRGIYALHTWIDGEDAQEIVPTFTLHEQYKMGICAGEILHKIHSLAAPDAQKDWFTRFNHKTDVKIQKYLSCGMRFYGDEHILEYIQNNRDLLKNRPQCFQHGDYHIGNMMIQKGKLIIIDFDRFDYGDPFEEFNRIVWCAQCSPNFASGILKGYFGEEPPAIFWRLIAFYISSNMLSSIYWSIPFGQHEINTMINQAKDILTWYNNMQSVIPTWYISAL